MDSAKSLARCFAYGKDEDIIETALSEIGEDELECLDYAASILMWFSGRCEQMQRERDLVIRGRTLKDRYLEASWAHVYIFYVCDGLYKIGWSKYPMYRVQTWLNEIKRMELGFDLSAARIVHLIATPDPPWCESTLHARYEKRRVEVGWSSEIFGLADTDITDLKRIGVMKPQWYIDAERIEGPTLRVGAIHGMA